MRSRNGRVSGITLNAAVVAFLDFGSGGAVGGTSASTSSRVATAGSLGRGETVLRAGRTEEIIGTPVARRPVQGPGKNPAGATGWRPPGWTGRPGQLFSPTGVPFF